MPPTTRIPAARLEQALSGARSAYPFWFPPEARDLAMDYFAYGADWEPLALSATQSRAIQINSDSAFMILSATMVETDTTNTVFFSNRPLLATIGTGGAALDLANTPIHVDNWFGTAEEPKYWDVPKILLPGTVLKVGLQNLEAVARNVRIAFHGFKLFKYKR
jgi:hypothetical protein